MSQAFWEKDPSYYQRNHGSKTKGTVIVRGRPLLTFTRPNVIELKPSSELRNIRSSQAAQISHRQAVSDRSEIKKLFLKATIVNRSPRRPGILLQQPNPLLQYVRLSRFSVKNVFDSQNLTTYSSTSE